MILSLLEFTFSTSTTFISNISQSNGVISATKKTLPTFAGSSQPGIVSASEGLSENYLLNATGGWTSIGDGLIVVNGVLKYNPQTATSITIESGYSFIKKSLGSNKYFLIDNRNNVANRDNKTGRYNVFTALTFRTKTSYNWGNPTYTTYTEHMLNKEELQKLSQSERILKVNNVAVEYWVNDFSDVDDSYDSEDTDSEGQGNGNYYTYYDIKYYQTYVDKNGDFKEKLIARDYGWEDGTPGLPFTRSFELEDYSSIGYFRSGYNDIYLTN